MALEWARCHRRLPSGTGALQRVDARRGPGVGGHALRVRLEPAPLLRSPRCPAAARPRRPPTPPGGGPVGHRAPPPGGRVRPADGGGRGLRRVRHGPGPAPPPGPGRPRGLRRGRPGPVRPPGAGHRGAVPAPHRGRQPERLGLGAGGLLLAAVLGPAALGRPPGGGGAGPGAGHQALPAAPALHPRGGRHRPHHRQDRVERQLPAAPVGRPLPAGGARRRLRRRASLAGRRPSPGPGGGMAAGGTAAGLPRPV